ncbi:hypothetical protein IQ272_30635 [Chroococcidiopsidales cyanobacterium LEGE 13417]|nr:hypothetical protein [Chroococcidiopsidales cyanobacterium LEGE 13417]
MKLIFLVSLVLIGSLFLIVGVANSINSLRRFSESSGRSNSYAQTYYRTRQRPNLLNRLRDFFFLLKFVPFFLILPFFFLIGFPTLVVIMIVAMPILFVTMPTAIQALEKVRQELEKYLDTAIPEIISDWNSQELIRRGSSDFLKLVRENELRTIFDICAKNLGKLTCYQVSRECCKSISRSQEIILASYESVAIFEKGTANIEVQILKKHGQYSINSMNINIGSKPCQQSFRIGVKTTLDALRNSRR